MDTATASVLVALISAGGAIVTQLINKRGHEPAHRKRPERTRTATSGKVSQPAPSAPAPISEEPHPTPKAKRVAVRLSFVFYIGGVCFALLGSAVGDKTSFGSFLSIVGGLSMFVGMGLTVFLLIRFVFRWVRS
jgi:hypothetical protein